MKTLNKLMINICLILIAVWNSAFANDILYIVTPPTEITGLPFTVDLYLNTSYIPSTVNSLNFDLTFSEGLTLNTQSVTPFFIGGENSGVVNDLFSTSFSYGAGYILIDRLSFMTNNSGTYTLNLITEIPNDNTASIFSDSTSIINIVDYNFPLISSTLSSVPEPASIYMFLIGLLTLCFYHDPKTKNN